MDVTSLSLKINQAANAPNKNSHILVGSIKKLVLGEIVRITNEAASEPNIIIKCIIFLIKFFLNKVLKI